ncbi:WD repeat-containing protein 1 [Dissostichus eleginoides]|uniref:WD repeat-containing protein 1 n=1 Tax=Dissostichus eleginoides TaxID=100907 RepID=A0AAD9FGG2_DISEL|nr:WD repeat-containing protein 1 [Dissostichus eleginoides]
MPYELKHVFASLPQMERGVAKVIGGDPKGNNFLYTNGKCVIIRNIENPAIADIYTEHAHTVTVAKYAPSGYYIASGDASGRIRIWDTTQKEHLLKYEYTPLSGKVKTLHGPRTARGSLLLGTDERNSGPCSCGTPAPQLGNFRVDIKQTRPYRLALASDDTCGSFFEGPPFKFKFTMREHSQFVNCVRFSPDGNRFVTAGADGQMFLYDGKDGNLISTLGGEKAHKGGIYAISWSPDSSQLISASGDKTQLGCLWQNEHLLTISLSGYINYLDKNNPDRTIRTVKGHSKSIQCVTVHKKDGRPHIYSGSHDGHINILFTLYGQ